MDEEKYDENFKTISTSEFQESATASLRVRLGGKAPLVEMEMKVIVTLEKVEDIPRMITETMDKLYSEAIEKQLISF